MRTGDSWIEIAIYCIWVVAALLLVGAIYVVVHFIWKFW
jgi:hypothetical protein